ncbi:hypothetical protein HDU92_003516 [Lobulomyces angularis]|nr:hypothetical protein HDU92_003516 [Lobulomyces angularis]
MSERKDRYLFTDIPIATSNVIRVTISVVSSLLNLFLFLWAIRKYRKTQNKKVKQYLVFIMIATFFFIISFVANIFIITQKFGGDALDNMTLEDVKKLPVEKIWEILDASDREAHWKQFVQLISLNIGLYFYLLMVQKRFSLSKNIIAYSKKWDYFLIALTTLVFSSYIVFTSVRHYYCLLLDRYETDKCQPLYTIAFRYQASLFGYFCFVDVLLGVLLLRFIQALSSKHVNATNIARALKLKKRVTAFIVIWIFAIIISLALFTIHVLYREKFPPNTWWLIFDIGDLLIAIEFLLAVEYFHLITALTRLTAPQSMFGTSTSGFISSDREEITFSSDDKNTSKTLNSSQINTLPVDDSLKYSIKDESLYI